MNNLGKGFKEGYYEEEELLEAATLFSSLLKKWIILKKYLKN